MTEFTMQLPAQALFGAGVRNQIGEQIMRLGASRALLVTDEFMLSSGPAEEFKGLIEGAGFECTVFADVQPDPTDASDADDDATAADRMVDGLIALNEQLQVPRLGALEQLEEPRFEANVAKMAADALASGSPARNPVVPTEEAIIDLYKEAW